MCGTDTIKDCFANQIFLAILIPQILCLQEFFNRILGVLHLTFSSTDNASNSPGPLAAVQKEAMAKQSDARSTT